MNQIKSLFRSIKQGIRNLIIWFPVIWKDRDYDHVFLLSMLEQKFDNMSEHFSKYGNHTTSDETAEELNAISKLIVRINNEDYREEAFGDKLYLLDKNEMVFIPIGDTGNSRIEFTGLTDDERKELLRLYRVENELLDKDIEKLFNMMKNIKDWWN